MRLTRTAKVKLDISPDLVAPTIAAYTANFNEVCKLAFNLKSYNGITLHNNSYSDARNTLPAQLAISARMKATEAVKSVIKLTKPKLDPETKTYINKFELARCPSSKQQAIRYDCNSYSLWLDKKEASLLTLNGRIRVKLNFHKHIEQYLSWKYCSAELFIRKNKVYLNIVFEKDIADVEQNETYIGIDRGINNLAVTSTAKFYGGKQVKQIQRKRQELRRKLQKKGTKSAKRHLRKLSGKERRFKADVNHCVAKDILAGLKAGDTIVLEELGNIRESSRKFRRVQRAEIHNWSYFQLEQFLRYKADALGIFIETVNAAYTSQRCSHCGHIERRNRQGSQFSCKKCGYFCNADLNAARVIRIKHLEAKGVQDEAVVNQPLPEKGLSVKAKNVSIKRRAKSPTQKSGTSHQARPGSY